MKLEFHKMADKKPANDQEIWLVYFSRFYGTQEFRFGTVEYRWDIFDENGMTGESYFEDPTEVLAPGERAECVICLEGEAIDPECFWIAPEDVDVLLPANW